MKIISEKSGFTPLGLVPHFPDAARLPAEDSVALERPQETSRDGRIKVAVPVLSRIANFDDFDPLTAEEDVALQFVQPGEALPGDADLVVLPGSKATLADLAFLREQGWDIDLKAHLRRGGHVLGVCAGYQMLGKMVSDPDGIEGRPGSLEGLGLLEVETVLAGDKKLEACTGRDPGTGAGVAGYEMHIGITEGPAKGRPFLELPGRDQGAVSADGKIMGCYLHGLFASDAYRHAFLSRLADREVSGLAYESAVEGVLDSLAAHLETHLDLDRILDIARNWGASR